MRVVTVPLGIPARLSCAVAVACLLGGHSALAFIVSEPDNPSVVTNAPEPTDADLRNQLQMHSGFGATGAGGGWTFVPTVSLQEAFTDNLLDTTNNRRWDLLTILTPSIAITGDTPNAQVLFEYGPQFRLAARTPQEDSISNQLLGSGLFTIVPDEFFVDARAVAGATPANGGYGSFGAGLAPSFGSFGSPLTSLNSSGNTALSNQNLVQVNSYSISPYWLHDFGDLGTARIGYQLSESSISPAGSYIPVFFPTGHNSSSNLINEGYAQFDTGNYFGDIQYHAEADAQIGNGTGFQGNSQQYYVLNRLTYVLNREFSVFGEIGYENLTYGGTPTTRIDDAIWGFGTTWTPNPDSRITIAVRNRYGDTNVDFNGSYQLTARTQIGASYTTGVQSNLQGFQNQLNQATVTPTGQTVNSVTGAPLLVGTNGLGVQAGVFRVKAFNANVTTVLDRDQFTAWLQISESTTEAAAPVGTNFTSNVSAPPVGSTSTARSVFGNWTHQISEDLTLSSAASFSTFRTSGSSNQQSWAVSIGIQYLISQTLAATASYSFYDYLTPTRGFFVPSGQNQSYYQNLVIVGLTKQF
ncbi:MAG TPA: hypothetical protein VGI78_07350 [Acetobacteraceae bacterium]|jgi:uncharacterized protein (PEP-CTERM system associated)